MASVDGEATSVLSSLVLRFLGGHTVVKDSVVGDIDCHFLVGGLVDDDTVDTVVVGNVVLEVESSLEVEVTGDVNSRAVDDSGLVVLSVVLNTCSEVSEILSEEEWETVAVSVDNIRVDGVGSCSLGFGEDDSRSASGGPPDGSIDQVLCNGHVVALVASDTGGGGVVNDVVTDRHIFDRVHFNSFSVVVRPGLSDAVLQHAGPLALTCGVAGRLRGVLSTGPVVIAASESCVLGTSLLSIDV